MNILDVVHRLGAARALGVIQNASQESFSCPELIIVKNSE
jgi:hypothetical protein